MTIPGRRFSRTALTIGGALLALFAISLVSLILHVARVTGPVGVAASALGRFLFDSFSWAGFFVPAYFLAGALLLAARAFRRRSALRLMLSIVPFLTLSLLLHVLQRTQAPLAVLLADSFGMLPAALLLFFLLALELIFMLTFPSGSGDSASGEGTARARGARSRHGGPRPVIALPAPETVASAGESLDDAPVAVEAAVVDDKCRGRRLG